MGFINILEQRLKALNSTEELKKILIIDGDDPRALSAALDLKKNNLVDPILLLETARDTQGVSSIVMNEKQQEIFAKKYFEMRKGKETMEAATKAFKTRPFYASMLLKEAKVDGVVGGLIYTTADILRAAFKVVGAREGIKTISSAVVVANEEQVYIFSDISVNVKPNSEQLAEIGVNAAEFAKSLGIEPTIAFLSFSTDGSAVTEESKLVANATNIFNSKNPTIPAIGEVQFDAALDLKVRKSKYLKPSFATPSNVFIFPDLNAGNIGYKIAQRLGGFEAIGPIITGISMPINDLSRGATTIDVYGTVLMTALQAKGRK